MRMTAISSLLLMHRNIIFATFLLLPLLISGSLLPLKSSSLSSAPSNEIHPSLHGSSHASLLLQRLLQAQIAEAQCVLRCNKLDQEALCLKLCQGLAMPKFTTSLCHLPTCGSRCKAKCFGKKRREGLVNFHLSLSPCSVTWSSASQPSATLPIQLLYLVAARDQGGKWHLVANPLAATSISILQLEHYMEVRVLAISDEGLEDEVSLLLNDDILHNPPFDGKPIPSMCREKGKRQERNTPHQNIPNKEIEVDLGCKELEVDLGEEIEGGENMLILILPSLFIILCFLAIFLLIKQTKSDTKAAGTDEKEFEGTLSGGDNDMPPIYEEIDNYCVL